jgi:hypothetical protein
MDAIAEQLADAVGLAGRNRGTSPNAKRARSAVTKCVKKAIHKIGEANPSLGYHLAARIKTGTSALTTRTRNGPLTWKF